MNLRKLPAALALGVPASLIGHGLLFGADHEMGGPFHGFVVSLALAAASSLAVFLSALAWRCVGAVNGSVLAARLAEWLPGAGGIFASAASAFALCESLEATHAAKSLPSALAVLWVASWIISKMARAVVRAIADATIAIAQVKFAPRKSQWCARVAERLPSSRSLGTQRHLARPPPLMVTALRA